MLCTKSLTNSFRHLYLSVFFSVIRNSRVRKSGKAKIKCNQLQIGQSMDKTATNKQKITKNKRT